MSKNIENPKQLILDNAKDILYNEGYEKLNMRNVAKVCDLAVGTIYNYFPTKKELVIEMMAYYWQEYFLIIDNISESDDLLYNKLHKVFNELSNFLKKFKSIWLKIDLANEPDYKESGLKKEKVFLEMLIKKIESILIEETKKEKSEISLKIDSYDTAKFITMNFITIVQMPVFDYNSFENILKKLFK